MSVLPANNYAARIVGAAMTESSNGNEIMAIEMNLDYQWNHQTNQWGPMPADTTRKLRLAFTDASWKYTKAKLQFLGFNGDFINPQFAPPADGIVLACKHTLSDRGEPREEWELANWGGEAKPANPDKLRVWAAKWKQDTAPSSAPATKPALPNRGVAPRPAAAPTPIPDAVKDEDIPFRP